MNFRERAALPYTVAGGFLAMVSVGSLAMLLQAPLLAPPLGATAFLCFTAPRSRGASPRSVLLSHALGLLCGYVALLLTSMTEQSSAFAGGFRAGHVLACALGVAGTILTCVLCDAPHPPAGATTLVVGLGILRQPQQLLIFECGVLAVVVVAIVVNRLAGIDFPLWRPAEESAPESALPDEAPPA